MRTFVVTLVILLGLAVAGDFVARNAAENQVAARAASSLELEDEPDVTIGGFPFLLNFARGTLPTVELAAEGVARRGITLREVVLTLENVRFDWEALSNGSGSVRIGGGTGRALLTEDDFNALLREQGVPAEVRVSDGAVVAIVEGAEAPAEVTLEGDSLLLSVPEVGAAYEIALPQIGSRMGYRSARLVERGLELRVGLRAGRLEL